MARSDRELSLRDTIIWGKQHDAFDSELGQSLLRVWEIGAADEHIAQMIREQVRPLQTRDAFGELEPFRLPRSERGEVYLGTDVRGGAVKIPLQSLTAGLLVAGNTGAGKSTLLSLLVVSIVTAGARVWLSDMYKTQLRHLRPLFRRVGHELVVLRPLDWKVNPLQVDALDPNSHLSMAVDVLDRTLGLPPRARSMLRSTIHKLYVKFGIFDGRTDAYPCLFDAFEDIRVATGANQPAREALLDRLSVLLRSLTPKCAAWRIAWTPQALSERSINFEMRGASEQVKQLLLGTQLLSLLHGEVQRGVVNGPLRLFVAFEDAQRFFDSQQGGDGSLTPMDELAGVIRGCGIGLGVNIQTAQGLSRKLVPNLATRIIGRLGTHQDYASLGSDMGLNAEQIERAKHQLRPGIFLAQLSDGGWRHPFVLRVPEAHVSPSVSDKEAERSVQTLNDLPAVAAPEYASWPARAPDVTAWRENQQRANVGIERQCLATNSAARPAEAASRPVSKELLDYLEEVAKAPFVNTTARDSALGLSASAGNRIRRELVDRGLVTKVAINPGGRGKRFQLLELTRQGAQLLESLGVRVRVGDGRGGLEHRFWVHTISEWLTSEGAVCSIEDGSRGARVDLTVETTDAGIVAVEVEVSQGHELANIEKDIHAGFGDVVSLVKAPGRVKTVRAAVESSKTCASSSGRVEVAGLVVHREILSTYFDSNA